MLDSSTRQMRGKTSATVRASFALLGFLPIRGWVGWVGRGVCRSLLFGLFFLGFGRRISGAFLLGQLFPGFGCRLGNPRLQFFGINLLGSRTKEASLVNGDRVLQVATNDFKLLELDSQRLVLRLPLAVLKAQRLVLRLPLTVLKVQRLVFRLPLAVLKAQRLVLLAQPPDFLRQPFLWGLAHRHNLWRAWLLSGYTYTAFLGTWIRRSRSPRLRPRVSPTSNQLLAA